ncbi:MAG: 2OG-Fe(II) oxygenase family protein [Candidatus Babeliales bacterium]
MLELIPAAARFGNTFYKDEYYATLQLPGYNGYKARDNVQAEGFYCEHELWQSVYSAPIARIAELMKEESVYITQKILHLVLPQLTHDTLMHATGGVSQGDGLYHLSFKHYRPEINAIGLTPHRDFGYVTILYIDKDGLHAKIDDAWHPIPPREGYFIVNFGRSLELLINDPMLLNASWHYVEQIKQEKHGGDRMCFALFSGCNLNSPLHRIQEDGSLEIAYLTYKEFVDAGFKDVYDSPDLSEITFSIKS